MAGETDNLVLEHLRKLRSSMDGLQDEMRHMNLRMGAIERILSGQVVFEIAQNTEVDRLKIRVDRIERRLELTETQD